MDHKKSNSVASLMMLNLLWIRQRVPNQRLLSRSWTAMICKTYWASSVRLQQILLLLFYNASERMATMLAAGCIWYTRVSATIGQSFPVQHSRAQLDVLVREYFVARKMQIWLMQLLHVWMELERCHIREGGRKIIRRKKYPMKLGRLPTDT